MITKLTTALRMSPRDWLRPERRRIIRAISPYTLLPHARLSHLFDLASSAPSGAFVECGSYAGGSGAGLAAVAPDRTVWMFDSWEGCPSPGPEDLDRDGVAGVGGQFSATLRQAQEIVATLGLPNVRLVKGWFSDTLPVSKAAIGPIALLHLDSDWYQSTKESLETLYDAVVPGGLVVIDDYGYWYGCRRAVDEFLSSQGRRQLHRFDDTEVWFRK